MNKNDIILEFYTQRFFTFYYYKADGSLRTANGTTDDEYISQFWTDTGNGYDEPEELIRYFDTDAQAWRSFKVDRFVSFEEDF